MRQSLVRNPACRPKALGVVVRGTCDGNMERSQPSLSGGGQIWVCGGSTPNILADVERLVTVPDIATFRGTNPTSQKT